MIYKIEWTLLSPIETQLQSDTIFGHLCWAIAYEMGKSALEKFLAEMQAPRLLLSSAFPRGTLPVPSLVPPLSDLPGDFKQALVLRGDVKAAKKLKFMPLEIWLSKRDNYVHREILAQNEAINRMLEQAYRLETSAVMHNSINRITGTTVKGAASLYSETVAFAADNTAFDSYLKTDYFSKQELDVLFGFIEDSGFGRNKHTGRGKFEIKISESSLGDSTAPNAWLLLSNMVPAPDDPLAACYEGFVKYGKLGGGYASGSHSPFKKPLFLIQPGSVFFGEKPPVGMLIRGIHPDDAEICQHGYAMCIGFRYDGGQNG